MTWEAALESLAWHPHIGRYRELCADDNPDVEQRDGYRGLMVRMATGAEPEPAIAVDYTPVVPGPCGGCP